MNGVPVFYKREQGEKGVMKNVFWLNRADLGTSKPWAWKGRVSMGREAARLDFGGISVQISVLQSTAISVRVPWGRS